MKGSLSKKAICKYSKALDTRLSNLKDANSSTEKDRAPVILDQTTQGRLSRMDALQVQAMALETNRRRGLEIKRIKSAINRIENGEFGYCLSCYDLIEIKRLNNDPATVTCIECAKSGTI